MDINGCHCRDDEIPGRTQGPHACIYCQEVGVRQIFARLPCWRKAPCNQLILRPVPPLFLHFLLSLDLCEAHVYLIIANRSTCWVGTMHADCPLNRTMRELICLSQRKDSGILHQYVLHVVILRHVLSGFVYIDS